jgi:dolichol-phosphate mannosyltransferase
MDKALLPHLQKSGKNINTPLFAYWLGFEPEILYYERNERIHGKSRWTFFNKLKLFIDSLLGFSIVPIRLISVIGILVASISFGYGCLVVLSAILGKVPVAGFATIVALISFLLGLIIIMLGIIGEYIWRIFDEVNHRPESVIDEIY